MDKIALAARFLCCPDCASELSGGLRCPTCHRALGPGDDGILSALPAALENANQSKDQLKSVIDTSGPGEHAENIVLYEKRFHDDQAPYYDKLFADPLPLRKYYKRLVRHQIYSYVHQRPFVVDLCCGTGKSSMPLVERGLLVVGMDVSREMLRIYKQKCDAKGYENAILVHADATRPPLRKESCDAITVIGGLHHIQERAECLNSCCRALAKDGVLILHEPLKTGKTSKLVALMRVLNALTDPSRVLKALRRRIGLNSKLNAHSSHQWPVPDFTPYERPFTSPEELLALMPRRMGRVILRSQGLLSFCEFSPYLQGRFGLPLASLVVGFDACLVKSSRANWSGDALFAVFNKL